ncbi:ABC transporter substrate-binding protein [Muricoccus radiodurans]|uniref:ABC transporter substrate-binding protein n=1 Tax=Muricoccus radiodurans TaxID=2231721 RepID=UPI003CF6BF9A
MTHPITRRAALAAGAGITLAGGARARIAAAQGATLRVGLVNFPPNIRPHENSGSSSMAVKLQLYRGLLSYDGQGRLVPEMAESWAAEGNRAYVFTLRENSRFHDGSPVTAADVKHTIDSITAGNSTAYLRPDFSVVERVEVTGPRSGRFVLKEPSAVVPHLVASYHAGIIPARGTLAAPGLPIGSGPFRLGAQERGTSITVERFDGFYKPGRPRVARIVFRGLPDENLRVSALQSGDVEIVETLPWQSFDTVEGDSRLRLDATVGPFMYLTFNARTGPFTDPRVRQAVGFAVNRDDVVKAALFGRGAPLGALPYPQGTAFETPDLFTHDPARARQLLAAAGVPNGFSCSLLATSTPVLHAATAEVVQQNLRDVGIDVTLRVPEWATRVTQGNRGQYEFAVMGSVGNWPDPDAVTAFITGPPAYPRSFGFESARIEGLLKAGREELDEAKRRTIYADLQRAAAEEVPIVGLAWRSQAFAMQKAVTGFRNLPGSLTFYAPVTLEDAALG